MMIFLCQKKQQQQQQRQKQKIYTSKGELTGSKTFCGEVEGGGGSDESYQEL